MSQIGFALAAYLASEIARLGVEVSCEEQDQQDHQHQPEKTTERAVAPIGRMRPARIGPEATDQGEHQNDDQHRGQHDASPRRTDAAA